jgi:transcriptional regulator with XRE-family HTH domain
MDFKPIIAANVTAYSDAWRGRGVSFTDQAERCNMPKGQFSEMRKGKYPSPSVWTVLRLSEGLGVSLDELVTDRPEIRQAACRRIFEGAKP